MPRHPVLSAVEKWWKYDAMEARLSAPLSERMLDLACVGPGMHVLDLATGRGEPAIRAAHRVGPSGSVLGVDVSVDMLGLARERADREAVTNLELRVGDAASVDALPEAHFDATLIRWGLMFMDSPVAALTRARHAMKTEGLLILAAWAEPERVAWYGLPRRVLAKYRPLPPVDPEAPDTCRYADTERLRRDLDQAGLRIVRSGSRRSSRTCRRTCSVPGKRKLPARRRRGERAQRFGSAV